jgi:hypothetical protein
VITVYADISEAYVCPRLNETIVVEEIENTKKRFPEWLVPDVRNHEAGKAYVGPSHKRAFDLKTWNAIGVRCAKLDKAIRIKIPRG